MKKNWLEPDLELGLTIQQLSIQHLLDRGIKTVLLDVDGTLLPRHEITLHNSVKVWVENAKAALDLHLLSNNPSKARIENISKQLNISFTYNAAKPTSKSLRRALSNFQQDPKSSAIVGDRLFTDILVGNRVGLYTVLVQPLGPNGKTSPNKKTQQLEKSIAAFFGARNK